MITIALPVAVGICLAFLLAFIFMVIFVYHRTCRLENVTFFTNRSKERLPGAALEDGRGVALSSLGSAEAPR
jgi:hypothetical protein